MLMSGNNVDNPETVKWDPNLTELAAKALWAIVKRWWCVTTPAVC